MHARLNRSHLADPHVGEIDMCICTCLRVGGSRSQTHIEGKSSSTQVRPYIFFSSFFTSLSLFFFPFFHPLSPFVLFSRYSAFYSENFSRYGHLNSGVSCTFVYSTWHKIYFYREWLKLDLVRCIKVDVNCIFNTLFRELSQVSLDDKVHTRERMIVEEVLREW